MDLVEELMATRRWRNVCLRSNIVPQEKIEMWKKVKLALVESNSPNKSLHDKRLVSAIRDIAPQWWDNETRICLNRNVQCKKHTDGNTGFSYILFLGDFEGGELLFEDGTQISEKNTWHRINGQIPHWNNPHTGTKYSIIIYQSVNKTKKTNIINRAKQSRAPPAPGEEEAASLGAAAAAAEGKSG
jgi:hypothetical protein